MQPLFALLLIACEPETVRQGSPEEVDLSGYATLEDLEALQVEIDELRAATEPQVLVGDCGLDSGVTFQLDEVVMVTNVQICNTEEGGTDAADQRVCSGTFYYSVRTSVTPDYHGYGTQIYVSCYPSTGYLSVMEEYQITYLQASDQG